MSLESDPPSYSPGIQDASQNPLDMRAICRKTFPFLTLAVLVVFVFVDEFTFFLFGVIDHECLMARSHEEAHTNKALFFQYLKMFLYGVVLLLVCCNLYPDTRGSVFAFFGKGGLLILILIFALIANSFHPSGAYTLNGWWRPCDASLLQWRCAGPAGMPRSGTLCETCVNMITNVSSDHPYVHSGLCFNAEDLRRCYSAKRKKDETKVEDKFRRMEKCCRRGGFMILRDTECNDPPEMQRIYNGAHMTTLLAREIVVVVSLLLFDVCLHGDFREAEVPKGCPACLRHTIQNIRSCWGCNETPKENTENAENTEHSARTSSTAAPRAAAYARAGRGMQIAWDL